MSNKIAIFALLVCALTITTARLSCLSKQGGSVDWFSLLKYPGDMTTRAPRYAYLDPRSGSSYQVITGALSDHRGQPLPNTIEAINSIPQAKLSVLLFNDQPPTAASNSRGAHAKGIIAFDSSTQTGVYILHSMPKFPSLNGDGATISIKIPESALKYGQHVYCVSLDRESIGHVMSNIPLMKPIIYHSTGMFKSLPAKGKEHFLVSQFHLPNGEDQWFLTKNPSFSGFLFEDVVSTYFGVNLATESWGRPYQGPHCSRLHSVNILKVAINGQDQWKNTNDHSKWTVSTGASGIKVACLCDMNRMNSQGSRGGSCLCSRSANLHRALSNIIKETDHC